MEREGMQDNNGAPMGYGQPNKKAKRMRRVVMDPQAEQLAQYGNPYEKMPVPEGAEPDATQTGTFRKPPKGFDPQRNGGVNPQGVPKLDPATGQYHTQPVGKPAPVVGGSMGAPSGYNFGGDATGYKSPDMTPNPTGLHDALMQSIQNGYTDIGDDTNPWQTGKFMNQLSGFNTGGWGSGERGTGTLKNRFGQIASNYDVTQKGALNQLTQDPKFMELTGGKATIVPHANQDLLDIDGPDGPMAPIDVIQSATEGGAGQAWAWQPQDEQAQMAPAEDWWNQGQSMAVGPNAPGNQIYNQALGINPQQMQNQGMDFLQWLLQQQQQGTLLNGGIGNSPVTF